MDNIINMFQYLEEKEIKEKQLEQELLEEEYKSFLRLLKYFVDINTPEINSVFVKISKDESRPCGIAYKITNPQNDDTVEDSFLHQNLDGNIPEGADPYDLLLSTLVMIAPRKVIISTFDPVCEFINMVKEVFSDCVVLANV